MTSSAAHFTGISPCRERSREIKGELLTVNVQREIAGDQERVNNCECAERDRGRSRERY